MVLKYTAHQDLLFQLLEWHNNKNEITFIYFTNELDLFINIRKVCDKCQVNPANNTAIFV